MKTGRTRNLANSHPAGFSLLEVVTALVAASLIMIVTLTVFNRIRSATASIHRAVASQAQVDDIFQLISEDLDKLATPNGDTRISIRNNTAQGITRSRLVISSNIYGSDNKARTFESVTWQTDYETLNDSFTLYRAHGGIALEDPLLDVVGTREKPSQEDLQQENSEPYIPVTTGLTYCRIVGLTGGRELETWAASRLPSAVKVTLSFAEPVEVAPGQFEIPEEELISRVITVDRTRKIKYNFLKEDYELPDPNDFAYDYEEQDNQNSDEEASAESDNDQQERD